MKKDYIPDYMCALQAKFFVEPEFPELQQEVSDVYRDMKKQMDQDGQRILLKMVDLIADLHDRIVQASFVAGFRLAHGIAKELSLEEPYSFAQDDAEQAANRFRQEKAGLFLK